MPDSTDSIAVLHVDDEPGLAEITGEYLERVDDRLSVEPTTSVDAALDLLDERDFDCVVSDLDMPGMDGIEFLAVVRGKDPDLPFILFTGKGSEEIASKAIAAGVTDYLQKESGTSHYAVLANRIVNAVDQARARRSELATERRLQTIIEHAPVGLFQLDREMRITYENPRAQEIIGLPRDEDESLALGTDIRELPSVEGEGVMDALVRLGSGEAVSFDTGFVSIYGKKSYLIGRGVPIVDDGTFGGAILMVVDITDRKRRERELERHEMMVEATGDAMYTLDDAGCFTYVNDALLEVTGYGEEDLLGEHVSLLVGESDVERGNELIRSLIESGERRGTIEMAVTTADGERIQCENHIALLPFDSDFRGTVGIVRDVTDRLERERQLAERTRQLEAVLDSVEAAIWIRDADHRFRLLNQNFRALFSIGEDEPVVGRRLGELLPDDTAAQFRANDDHVIETEAPLELEEVVPTPEGPRTYLTRILPMFDDGDLYGTCGVASDITEIRDREEELQRERDRLDEFVSVVSHDLRNPLGVAIGRLDLLEDEEDVDSDHLDAATRALDRMDALIDDLLDLSREGAGVGDYEPVDIGEIARRCWDDVPTDAATLEVEIDRVVEVDRSRFRQLIENLFRNAVEHGGEGVTVSVGDLPDGFYVADEGPGIDEAEREAVFDLGFSTTADGTGFGLNIVAQVAEAHGWRVTVTEADSGGARFEITGLDQE